MVGRVILLTGKMGSGKSTVADRLVEEHEFWRVKLAKPLKDMIRTLGVPEEYIEGDLKNTPCQQLNGHTARYAMQTLGTEWGRNLLGNDFWTNIAVDRIRRAISYGEDIVVDDMRFHNELEALKKAFPESKAYRIHRPKDYEMPEWHASEQEIYDLAVDHVIFNDGSLEKLNSITDQMVKAYV